MIAAMVDDDFEGVIFEGGKGLRGEYSMLWFIV